MPGRQRKDAAQEPQDDVEPCREHFPDGWPSMSQFAAVACEHGQWTRPATLEADDGTGTETPPES